MSPAEGPRRRDEDADDALGAERALSESVREAAQADGRAQRESELENLTEATHGRRTDEPDHAPPPPVKDVGER